MVKHGSWGSDFYFYKTVKGKEYGVQVTIPTSGLLVEHPQDVTDKMVGMVLKAFEDIKLKSKSLSLFTELQRINTKQHLFDSISVQHNDKCGYPEAISMVYTEYQYKEMPGKLSFDLEVPLATVHDSTNEGWSWRDIIPLPTKM